MSVSLCDAAHLFFTQVHPASKISNFFFSLYMSCFCSKSRSTLHTTEQNLKMKKIAETEGEWSTIIIIITCGLVFNGLRDRSQQLMAYLHVWIMNKSFESKWHYEKCTFTLELFTMTFSVKQVGNTYSLCADRFFCL